MLSYSKLVSHPDRPLRQHLEEVDRISAVALQAKYISPELAATDAIEFWRRLLVYFHDFGKSTVYFQHKIIQAIARENPEKTGLDANYVDSFYQVHALAQIQRALEEDSKLGSHAELGAYVVQHNIESDNTLLRLILLACIKRHHGDLKNFGSDEFILYDEKKEQLSRQWEHANRADYLFICQPKALQLPEDISAILDNYGGPRIGLFLNKALPLPDIREFILTKFMFSLLLAADKGDMMLENRSLVGQVMVFPNETVDLYKIHLFEGKAPKAIDLIREEAYQQVAQNIERHCEAPYFSITLPTGLGKTFTAYNAAIRLQNLLSNYYSAQNIPAKPRIIYCLPFTSVIDQNALILEQILKNINLQDGYLARHHYLSDWPTQKDEVEQLSDPEKEYFTEGWEYPFTVTTFVQLLETVFSNKNRKLRKFHNLANAIVILDEVQNIPAKYFETIETIFDAMAKYFNTKFIFVTATQPFLITQKPVIELTDPAQLKTEAIFRNMDRISMDTSRWQLGELPTEMLWPQFQKDVEAEPDKSFLFILNKVKDSQSLYQYLQESNPDAEMIYLSAAVLPCLRKKRIQQIKDHDGTKQLLVVTTQVVEAGVDIDLDIVYRDMAPLDSINQSAGRCNRNGLKGKGALRLFRSQKGTSPIYDTELVNITTMILNQAIAELGEIIPESEFYTLNWRYAHQIREKIANDNAHSKLIDDMRSLRFEAISKEFKLIDDQQNRHSVFIDFCEESNGVWSEYVKLAQIKDKWERKKQMRKIRPRLLQYIVQFPDKALPDEFKDDDKAIIYLGPAIYERCYNLITGYGSYETPVHNSAIFS